MKKINVDDKTQIKQLLYMGNVFAVRDDQYRSFGGFQLWWYDKPHDVCRCCESHWSDARKRVQRCSLDKAARILWHNRQSLFVRSKHVHEDRRLAAVGHFENAGQ
ncbi:MAG: hypothetical protein ACYTEK_03070 [Planctomycetota bacterium]|jgi:hypothetical protein